MKSGAAAGFVFFYVSVLKIQKIVQTDKKLRKEVSYD